MELHVFLQWVLNFFFLGIIIWQWNLSKKPKLISSARLPSLHDEKAKSLISTLETMTSEASIKLTNVTEQLTSEVIAAKKQMGLDASLQKHHWEKEMQALRKQFMSSLEEDRKTWTTESIESRMQLDQHMAKLRNLCNEAQKVISASKSLEFSENPSHEENEIKEALIAFEENQIPTVRELEDVRSRLKRESQLDLKSVLKEQLA